jgi:uncharacterized damage-inducible protein DinB
MKELLISYTNYNLWANTKLLGFIESAAAKDPAVLDKEIPSSFNTLRKTLYHIYYAENIWYKRLNGDSPVYAKKELENIAAHGNPSGSVAAGLQPASKTNFSLSDLSQFKTLFLSQSQKFIDYVNQIEDNKLLSDFDYKSTEGKPYRNKIWQSVHHCMNHSTFHRGQLITMLRNAGYTDLTSTDFITYIRGKNP